MRQYMEIKEKHQDMVLFFRLGDFYEMFGSDAEEVSHLLNLTLTHRARTPMCGIPYHAARNYLKRLLDAGKKVAICEQLSLSDSPRELAKRSVTEIYTPATVVDEEYLDSLSSSFVLAVEQNRKGIHAAWADISTGIFRVRTLPAEKDNEALESLLSSVAPKEIIVPDDLYFTEKPLREVLDRTGAMITKLPSWYFSVKEGKKEAEKQFSRSALGLFGIGESDPLLSPIGAILKYIADNTKSEMPQLRAIERIEDRSYLELNAAAVRNLELTASLSDGRARGSLFNTINRTRTASGGRFLKDAILHPLVGKADIEKRLDWVTMFYSDRDELRRVRDILSSSSDLERLSAKASLRRLTPRDMIAIADTSSSFFELISGRDEYLGLSDGFSSAFDTIIDFSSDILHAVNRECTNVQNEGTVILTGYDSELDEARSYLSGGEEMLSAYMDRIRTETGIQNMKSGENRIIGAYFEVSKSQVDKVPDFFIRRQTLVGGERYTTEELEEMKEKGYRGDELVGRSGVELKAGIPEAEEFRQALLAVMQRLAREMVMDGEGATKFIHVEIEHARSTADAKLCAEAVANSLLCKTAWFGGDPNWGRVVAALGYSGAKFDPEKTDIYYDNMPVVRNGGDAGTPESALCDIVKQREFTVRVNLHDGDDNYWVWTSDVSYEYVKINADYHT